jgi:hypothetical protein
MEPIAASPILNKKPDIFRWAFVIMSVLKDAKRESQFSTFFLARRIEKATVKFTAEESNPLWSNGSVWHRREA